MGTPDVEPLAQWLRFMPASPLVNRLEQLRRVARRYEKRAVHYLAMLTIAAALLWL